MNTFETQTVFPMTEVFDVGRALKEKLVTVAEVQKAPIINPSFVVFATYPLDMDHVAYRKLSWHHSRRAANQAASKVDIVELPVVYVTRVEEE